MPRTMMPGGVPSNSRAWTLRDAQAFHLIHRGSTDGAGHFPAISHYGEQQDHPVVVIASNVAACEGHQAFLPKRSDLTDQLFLFTTGGGFISAILRRQSASEECGPETKVPLTMVEYQPDSTPRRSDSSVKTCRGERFCIRYFRLTPFPVGMAG